MSKLLSQGGFGCTFYPGVTCDSKTVYSDKTITKIQQKNTQSENESTVGSIVRDIPSYALFFLPVINECPIDLRKISQKEISKCKIIKNYKDEYVAMEVPYMKEIRFTDMIKIKTAKDIIITVIESYKYLLMALEKLQQVNVVHFDLKLDNILFNEITYDPRIIDFGISIPIKNLTETNLRNYFYRYVPEYYVWCVDVHIICFLIHETKNTLTNEDVETIATLYVSNNRVLEFFPRAFSSQYLDMCITHLKTYVGKPSSTLIWELIGHSHTWDNYSLSVMYLRMITLLFPKNNSKNKFLNLFGELLVMNIHPDPKQRLITSETGKKFYNMFYMDGDVESYLTIANQFEQEKSAITENITTQLYTI